MQCTNPLFSYAVPYFEDGILKRKIFFNSASLLKSPEYQKSGYFDIYELPCGKCLSCRENRARSWALRLKMESYCHDITSFITLTYDDAHLPEHGNLYYKHVQLFLKKLRKKLNHKIRFFCAGEYGSINARPHYHIIIFGYFPSDCKHFSDNQEHTLYTSETLSTLWPFGNAVVCRGDFATFLYTARYAVKKIADFDTKKTYKNIDKKSLTKTPEFCRMSLKPGIGYEFIKKFQGDFRGGQFIENGNRFSIPRYVKEKLVQDFNPAFSEVIDQNITYAKL